MGHSHIVPGASYDEPAMRAAVKRLITQLDLHDVTLLSESMGAVLALTTAADLPDRVRRVVAVNAYDYAAHRGRPPPGLPHRRPCRLRQPAQSDRGPVPLPRRDRTGAPHLRRVRLVSTLRPLRQQAAAPRRPIDRGGQGRPLHRPGKARRASQAAQLGSGARAAMDLQRIVRKTCRGAASRRASRLSCMRSRRSGELLTPKSGVE
jgi:pimeloyl-ACP methyl ester carboxylesterase